MEAGNGSGAPLSRGERRTIGRIAEFLGFADLMAVLMVLATAFSAVATWRTASIANALYLATERPYFGVAGVRLDASRPGDPRVEFIYRNDGDVAAENVVIECRMRIDEKLVPEETRRKNAGILSPKELHHFQLHIPREKMPAILAGHSSLSVEIAADYEEPNHRRQLCYVERFAYAVDESAFDVNGGTADCASRTQFETQSR